MTSVYELGGEAGEELPAGAPPLAVGIGTTVVPSAPVMTDVPTVFDGTGTVIVVPAPVTVSEVGVVSGRPVAGFDPAVPEGMTAVVSGSVATLEVSIGTGTGGTTRVELVDPVLTMLDSVETTPDAPFGTGLEGTDTTLVRAPVTPVIEPTTGGRMPSVVELEPPVGTAPELGNTPFDVGRVGTTLPMGEIVASVVFESPVGMAPELGNTPFDVGKVGTTLPRGGTIVPVVFEPPVGATSELGGRTPVGKCFVRSEVNPEALKVEKSLVNERETPGMPCGR